MFFIIIILLFWEFFPTSISRWFPTGVCVKASLQSSRVSWTFLSILANLNNSGTYVVSTRHFISSTPCTNHLLSVLRAPVLIGVAMTSMFHNYFCSLKRSCYLHLFTLSFSLTQWLVGTAKSPNWKVFFFFSFFFFCRLLLGPVVWRRLGDSFLFQNYRNVCVSHFPGLIPGCAYTIYPYGQI